jgi:hypothetical protein
VIDMNRAEAGLIGTIRARVTNDNKFKERVALYNNDPKLCKFCKEPLVYSKRKNKFCNHSCSQSFNNRGIRRHGADKLCLNCKTKLKRADSIYCNNKCYHEYKWRSWCSKIDKIGYFEGFDASKSGGGVTKPKRYLLFKQKGACAICGRKTWCGKPIPFVLDHINGDPNNWSISNVRVICRNCDGQLDTYCGKNKGSGSRPFINSRNKNGEYIKKLRSVPNLHKESECPRN